MPLTLWLATIPKVALAFGAFSRAKRETSKSQLLDKYPDVTMRIHSRCVDLSTRKGALYY